MSLRRLAAAVAISVLPFFAPADGAGASTPDAAVVPVSQRVLRKSTIVLAPIAEVWAAWTDPTRAPAFFGAAAEIELRPGGKYEIHFVPDAPAGSRGSEGCTVLAVVPEDLLVFTWNAPPTIAALRESGARTQVAVRFSRAGKNATRVELTQTGFGDGADWEAYYKYFDAAWTSVLKGCRENVGQDGAELKYFVTYLYPARMEAFIGGANAMTEEERAAMKGHSEWLRRHTKEGTVIFAGPSFDPPILPTGEKAKALENKATGLVLIAAGSQEEAEAIMNGDPAVSGGVFQARMNPLTFSLFREWTR